MVFTIPLFVLLAVALAVSALGFKKYVWFISLGYGFTIAAEGVALLILFPCSPLAVAACAFILCANTKFTGLAYAGVFTCAFCTLYLWRWHRGAPGFSTRRTLALGASFVATLLVSVLLVGYTPYVTNTLDHGNPLYPLFGQDAVDIMTPQEPPTFNDASTPQKLFYATFSQSANISAGSTATPQLKLPLTWTPGELAALIEPDLRLGGFGVLYSAAALLGLPFLALALLHSRAERRGFFEVALAFLIPSAILALCLSDSWWARYSPYLYAVNLLTLTYFALPRNPGSQTCDALASHARVLDPRLASAGQSCTRDLEDCAAATYSPCPTRTTKAPRLDRTAQAAVLALALLLGANALFSLRFSTLENLERSQALDAQIAQLKLAVEQDDTQLFVSYDYMPGLVYTLWDRSLEFELEPAGTTQGYDPQNALGALRYRLVTP